MSKLILKIERGDQEPFEVGCDYKAGMGLHCYNGFMADNECTGDVPCPACNGTGKRTVCVVGEVELTADSYSVWFTKWDTCGVDNDDLWTNDLADMLITAFRDGTLPDALKQSITNPNGLRLEDVSDES